jgi:plastocyanin
MNSRAVYSFACAAFAAVVASGSLAGCFSERVAGVPPIDELCEGSPPNVIQIRNFSFVQKSITVAPGTRVTWANCDEVIHTSTADGGAWDSGAINPGTSFSRTFSAGGSFPFHCNPHPSMKGTVTVS